MFCKVRRGGAMIRAGFAQAIEGERSVRARFAFGKAHPGSGLSAHFVAHLTIESAGVKGFGWGTWILHQSHLSQKPKQKQSLTRNVVRGFVARHWTARQSEICGCCVRSLGIVDPRLSPHPGGFRPLTPLDDRGGL